MRLSPCDDANLVLQSSLVLDGAAVSFDGLGPSGAAVLRAEHAGDGVSSIAGTGQIVFNGDAGSATRPPNRIHAEVGTTLTIDPGIEIATGTGSGAIGPPVPGASGRIVNRGLIWAKSAGQRIVLEGRWNNQGTLRVSAGELVLAGTYATSDIGNVEQTGGVLVYDGSLDNTNQTLALPAGGDAWLRGKITGGRIENTGGARLVVGYAGSAGIDNVVLDSDFVVRNGSLAVGGTSKLTGSRVTIDGSGPQYHGLVLFVGDHTVDAPVEFVFDGPATGGVVVEQGTLVLGTGVVVRTGSGGGSVGNGSSATDAHLVNRGTISARTPGKTITVSAATVTTPGTLESLNGATLVASNLTGSLGNLIAGADSSMTLSGHPTLGMVNALPRTFAGSQVLSIEGKWTNAAPVSMTDGKLTLSGNGSNASTISALRSEVVLGGSTAFDVLSPNLGTMTLTDSTLLISGRIAPSQMTGMTFVNTPVMVTGVIERLPGSNVPVTLTAGSGDWIIKGGLLQADFQSPDGTGLIVAPATPAEDSVFQNVTLNVPLTVQAGATLRGTPMLNGRLRNAGVITMPQHSGGTMTLAAGSENTGTIVLERATPIAKGAGLRNDGLIRLTQNSTFEFQSGNLTGTGDVEVEAGSNLHLFEGGRQDRLAVAGFVRLGDPFQGITGGAGRLTVKEFSLAGTPGAWTGKLDLRNGALAIDYDPGGASPLGTVIDQLRTARGATGAWNGPGGITSARAAVSSTSTLGYGEAFEVLGLSGDQTATWRGDEVDATSVLVAYVRRGDANLNGRVDFDDLAALAQSYNGPAGAGVWWRGDFNYDAKVDFDDLAILAQNYNVIVAAPVPAAAWGETFAADVERAFAAVPEPGSFALLAMTAVVMGTRRRRRFGR